MSEFKYTIPKNTLVVLIPFNHYWGEYIRQTEVRVWAPEIGGCRSLTRGNAVGIFDTDPLGFGIGNEDRVVTFTASIVTTRVNYTFATFSIAEAGTRKVGPFHYTTLVSTYPRGDKAVSIMIVELRERLPVQCVPRGIVSDIYKTPLGSRNYTLKAMKFEPSTSTDATDSVWYTEIQAKFNFPERKARDDYHLLISNNPHTLTVHAKEPDADGKSEIVLQSNDLGRSGYNYSTNEEVEPIEPIWYNHYGEAFTITNDLDSKYAITAFALTATNGAQNVLGSFPFEKSKLVLLGVVQEGNKLWTTKGKVSAKFVYAGRLDDETTVSLRSCNPK